MLSKVTGAEVNHTPRGININTSCHEEDFTCCPGTGAPAPTAHLHLSAAAPSESAACQWGGTTSIHLPLLPPLPLAPLSFLPYAPGTADFPVAPPKRLSPPQELPHLQNLSSPFEAPAPHFQNLHFLPHTPPLPWRPDTQLPPRRDGLQSTARAPTRLQSGQSRHTPEEIKISSAGICQVSRLEDWLKAFGPLKKNILL